MKIAFISGVIFGHELLDIILKNNFDVRIIFSYENSKKGVYSDYVSFDDLAKKYNLQNVKVKNINDVENLRIFQEIQPDLILVMGWSQLLKKDIIKIPKLGVIGSHPTELPKYRGRAPIPWTIIKGLKESALTFFYIQEGVDNGDILDQSKFKVAEEDDASSLYQKITDLGRKMIIKNLQLIKSGKNKRTKQDESKFLEYWPKRTPDDGKIDWSLNGNQIHTLIRATTHPYPGAFTYFNNLKLIIWKTKFLNNKNSDPGRILSVSNVGVKIGTGNSDILLELVSYNEQENVRPGQIFSRDDINKILSSEIN